MKVSIYSLVSFAAVVSVIVQLAAPSACLQVVSPKRVAALDEANLNATNIFESLFKKKPYSKLWTVEQKWDDIFRRFMSIQDSARRLMVKNFMRDIEYYIDISISYQCAEDLRYIQEYVKKSTNFRWLMHMFDSTGKEEPGTLAGNLAHLGHVIQCIKTRAPARPSNDTFDERYFEEQTEYLGERFRGKYCLASVRPVMPDRPWLVSRFEHILNKSLLSNVSYMGDPVEMLKRRANEISVPKSIHKAIDREHNRLDQVPFESELYAYMIEQRNFMYTLPRFIGVCYPDSCTKDDIQYIMQKTMDDQHQVVDIEFECEVEEKSAWNWFNTPRLIVYVFVFLIFIISLSSSLARHILIDRLGLKHDPTKSNSLASLIAALDMMSMDKCAGILFVKTKQASPIVDRSKVENNRSTSIDALKGFLMLMLVYSELIHLGCLPVPFMWSRWVDALFPFYRSVMTQAPLNSSIWTEAFYIISAYLISLKILENNRPSVDRNSIWRAPNFTSFAMKRYIRLLLPMAAFILLNYIWPRLSNGFAMQDQANKLLKPCDNYGWTNTLMFHNYNYLNETCLWPSHVSATFFQLHLLSYPILLLLIHSLRTQIDAIGTRGIIHNLLTYSGLCLMLVLGLFGLVYPALSASNRGLIVPFLADYIDYDNYRRVIEWTVMPTHNHLTSYMMGIWLAYLAVRQRMKRIQANGNNWHNANYMHRDGSLESVISSSTQELSFKPSYSLNYDKSNLNSATASTSSSHNIARRSRKIANLVASVAISAFFIFIAWLASTVSWFWNGLGQPMSANQTFWYMIGTKLVFNTAFAYLFYKHFALRRNSANPWMLVRFLVPIGRMSLMVFYMSWLVIWFDLLTSLYQWHPSHYFVFEKFNEIIFMTVILAMLAYGAFEGTYKISQYAQRRNKAASQSTCNRLSTSGTIETAQGFEHLFVPLDDDDHDGTSYARKAGSNEQEVLSHASKMQPSNKLMANRNYKEQSAGVEPANNRGKSSSISHRYQSRPIMGNKLQQLTCGQGKADRTQYQGSRHLSIADQYKLNAELRANYSFASIGLYESAGAISDLPNLSDLQRDSPDVQSSRKS